MNADDLRWASEEAGAFRHPQRSMRVVLECAHMKLIPNFLCGIGIGGSTTCTICPGEPTRVVVAVQETGVLNESYLEGK